MHPPATSSYSRLIALLAVLVMAACEQQTSAPEPTGEVYRIGYANFIKDHQVSERDDVLEGILAANKADPFLDNGDRLEIVYQSKTPPLEQAFEQLQLYAGDNGVSALLLGSGSRIALELKPMIEVLELPALAITATHPDVVSDTSYVSQLGFDDQRQAGAAALFVRDELLIRRVAVVFDGHSPHSSYLAQEFRTKFENTGGVVTGFHLLSDVDARILKELRQDDTRFVYMPLSAEGTLDLFAKMDSIEWTPAVMAADGLLASIVREYPNRWIELQGMYVTDLYTTSKESVYTAAYVEEVASAYEVLYGDQVSTLTVLGIEAYRSIHDAMNQCPNRENRVCINQALRSGKTREGVISRYSIQKDGRTQRPVYINRIVDDNLELVVKVN